MGVRMQSETHNPQSPAPSPQPPTRNSALRIPHSALASAAEWLPLTILTAITLVARLYAVRDLRIPLFGDSLHHTVIVQMLINQGGVPTTYRPFAPVDSFTYHFGFHALAALWSQCAWLMRRILMSVNLNPSLSTLAWIRGTFSGRSLLIRMWPSGVVTRNEPRFSVPT